MWLSAVCICNATRNAHGKPQASRPLLRLRVFPTEYFSLSHSDDTVGRVQKQSMEDLWRFLKDIGQANSGYALTGLEVQLSRWVIVDFFHFSKLAMRHHCALL